MRVLEFIRKFELVAHHISLQHSTVHTTRPANPRKLGTELSEWTSFQQELEADLLELNKTDYPFLTFDPESNLSIESNSTVTNEASVIQLGNYAFEQPTIRLFRKVYPDYDLRFDNPRCAVNIGDPDRVISYQLRNVREAVHARCLIEYKTPWALPMNELIEEYNKARNGKKSLDDKVVKAVHQIYGYMSFNNLKYGILTNYESTYILRRVRQVDDGDDEDGEFTRLECSPKIRYDGAGLKSPIAAYIFICRQIFEHGWFHVSPVDKQWPKATSFKFDNPQTINPPFGSHNSTENVEFMFDQVLTRNIATVVQGRLQVYGSKKTSTKSRKKGDKKFPIVNQNVIFKIYDLSSSKVQEFADNEVAMYKKLKHLQGNVIPLLYTHGIIWNMLYVLVLENCGQNLEKNRWEIPESKVCARQALIELHKQGIIHGDVAFRNFVYNNSPLRVRLIDFERAEESNETTSFGTEMEQFESLEYDG